MHASLAGNDDLPQVGTQSLTIGPHPLLLHLTLGDHETLDQLDLRLIRAPETPPVPTVLDPAQLTTDAASLPLTNLTWITADWNTPRALDRIELTFTTKPDPLLVRVKIARGQSSWYPPPGPQQFTMGAALTLTAAFPNTIADRLMLELFADPPGGQLRAPVTLPSPTPLSLTFGQHARDISVGLQGHRAFLHTSGRAPTGEGLSIDGLLDHLHETLGQDLRGQSIAIELRADIAGEVTLAWNISTSELTEQFHPDLAEATLQVPWNGAATCSLPLPSDTPRAVLGLTLAVTSVPNLERIILAPTSTSPPTAHAQLARPLYDVAQSQTLADPRPLTAIDLHACPLTSKLTARLGLHPDTNGRPAPTPLFEIIQTITITTTTLGQPAWISFPLPAPRPLPPALYWLVLTIDEGELLWFVEGNPPPDAGLLLFRRDAGAWLPRGGTDSSLWAMTRLHVLDDTPPSPPTLELVGFTQPPTSPHASPDFVAPLPLDANGRAHWSPTDPTAPPILTALALRISSTVATTLTLSSLELRHRPTTD